MKKQNFTVVTQDETVFLQAITADLEKTLRNEVRRAVIEAYRAALDMSPNQIRKRLEELTTHE